MAKVTKDKDEGWNRTGRLFFFIQRSFGVNLQILVTNMLIKLDFSLMGGDNFYFKGEPTFRFCGIAIKLELEDVALFIVYTGF